MVTLTLTDEQAELLQRGLEDLVDVCSDHYNALCAEGATEGALESARRNHRQAADLANALERARLRVAPIAEGDNIQMRVPTGAEVRDAWRDHLGAHRAKAEA